MSDVVDRATRSRMMAAIRSRNTNPELVVRKLLFAAGYRFRLHAGGVPGRPDIVVPRLRVAILVHGCFWHRHDGCKLAYTPRSNAIFWKAKFAANVLRDERVERALREVGWTPLTIWECQIRAANFKPLLRTLRSIDSRVKKRPKSRRN